MVYILISTFILIGVILFVILKKRAAFKKIQAKKILQERARQFLDWKIPESIDYVPNSISELLIRKYANTGEIPCPEESNNMLQLCVDSGFQNLMKHKGEAHKYFSESLQILMGIHMELLENNPDLSAS